ncbi:MAG: SDR family NAD(P)-dependent oxidoreductase [Chloroflexi bacterium]|nr:SDR family NAD(P)-dependent oxidoreductase [Chloroflexota bacterium]MBL7061458.1 SDR family NAD(P)-dependent oxidoreductase [Dehalococcoidia bacterium]
MSNRLKDRVAIVTGSGQGIGRAIAMALAREGAKVVTNNRRPGTSGGDAGDTARQITDMGGQAMPFFGSVSDFEVAGKLVQAAVDKFGRLDILVNNAGADRPHMVWNMTEEEWDTCVDSFLKGTFNCTRFACGVMREQKWGRIMNTTSTAWLGTVGHCNYGAAKAGIVGLTRAVAREMGRYGVTCNAYAPTAATRFTVSEEIVAGFKKRYEAGLVTKERYEELTNPPNPETVTPFIVYLCTDEAADINGQVFDVTGGNVAIYSEPVKKKDINKEEGLWTVEELIGLVPKVLLEGYSNPSPSQQ